MRRRVRILSEPIRYGGTPGKAGGVSGHKNRNPTAVFRVRQEKLLEIRRYFGIICVEEMIAVPDRPDYINAVTPFIDKPLGKILAGIENGLKIVRLADFLPEEKW